MHSLLHWHRKVLFHRGQDHDVLIKLNLNDVLVRLEHARGAATRWHVATVAFAGLLWLWLQAPSFDLLPSVIRASLRILGFLGGGVFGAANSSVGQVADYFNLGYGVLFGPVLLFFIALGWLSAERRVATIRIALAENPALQSPSKKIPRARHVMALFVAAVTLGGSSVAAFNRFFAFQGHEQDMLCDREAMCQPHENYWIAPWRDADRSTLSWLRPRVTEDWCVDSAPGWPPGFRGVLKDQYFTRQIERLPKYVCSHKGPQLQKREGQQPEPFLDDSTANLGRMLTTMISGAVARDPYQQFPYVYPLINLPLLLMFGLGQFYILVCIVILRRLNS